MSKVNIYLRAVVAGGVSGMSLVAGLEKLLKYYSAIDSIRDAVYAHADKITPEIIEQANNLVSEVSKKDFYMALVNLAGAGVMGAFSYIYARRTSDPKPAPQS